FKRSSACHGVIAPCDARVCTSGFEGAVAGGSAVATRAPSARHRTTAETLRRVEPSRRSGGIAAPVTQSPDSVQPRRGKLDAFAGDLFITWSQPLDMAGLPGGGWSRSEEHTSELQSRGELVCC